MKKTICFILSLVCYCVSSAEIACRIGLYSASTITKTVKSLPSVANELFGANVEVCWYGEGAILDFKVDQFGRDSELVFQQRLEMQSYDDSVLSSVISSNTIPYLEALERHKDSMIIAAIAANMVYISGGTFIMGGEEWQDYSADEKPTHQVTLSGFKMGKYEVTQEEWEAVMGNNPSKFKNCPNCPVENVSWYDVQLFLEKLNAITSGNYRLPTEAEWEYAARGGTEQYATYMTSDEDRFYKVAWYLWTSNWRTNPVGQKLPNALGLYDLMGNVWEWCGDWYGKYKRASQLNPQGPAVGSFRVLRGGGWFNSERIFRESLRALSYPDRRFNFYGFRLVSSISPENEKIEAALALQRREEKEQLRKIVIANISTNMVHVTGDTFTMGCTDELVGDCDEDEKPAHQVTLSSFKMGKYEVTQAEWEAVMGSNPSDNTGCPDCPVENVNWYDIQLFLQKLNTMTGGNYRLPTEAEWEYAARGGNRQSGTKYSGSDDLDAVAWYDGNLGRKTHPVGQKQANALGLYDMSGNVWEWCSDWYGEDYYSSPSGNPSGPSSGTDRVLRGGGWYSGARSCRVSNRDGGAPEYRLNFGGFRLVSPSL